MELSLYFFATLRYCLWGRIHDFGDGVNTFPPNKIGNGTRSRD